MPSIVFVHKRKPGQHRRKASSCTSSIKPMPAGPRGVPRCAGERAAGDPAQEPEGDATGVPGAAAPANPAATWPHSASARRAAGAVRARCRRSLLTSVHAVPAHNGFFKV